MHDKNMINYLEKYNNLPKDLRDKISAPSVMEAIHEMEKKYSLNLAGVVMRVVVKDLKIDELQNFFVYNMDLNVDKAKELITELKKKVFSAIKNYLDYINKAENFNTTKNTPEKLPMNMDVNNNEAHSTKGADFYFSIEDEDEVRNQAMDFGNLDKREEMAEQVENKIADIMGQINIIFSSEAMSNRLQGVLKTYLRGVRDQVDTRLALGRETANGGLGLDEDIADDILKIVDVINKDEKAHPGRIIKHKKFHLPEDEQNSNNEIFGDASLERDVAYDFSKLDAKEELVADDNKKEESVEKEEDILVSLGQVDEDKDEDEKDLVLDLSTTVKADDKKEQQEQQEQEQAELKSVEKSKDVFSSGAIAKARNKQAVNINNKEVTAKQFNDMSGKIKMEDIKKVSKLGGPLEEISSMNLVDFRRLSKDSKEAVKKILGMFELLEEDSFSKRMEGVKVWRKSPINKIYLNLGQESIIEQKDIKTIIEKRKKEKKDYLSQEEFNAIMELNAKLRY